MLKDHGYTGLGEPGQGEVVLQPRGLDQFVLLPDQQLHDVGGHCEVHLAPGVYIFKNTMVEVWGGYGYWGKSNI